MRKTVSLVLGLVLVASACSQNSSDSGSPDAGPGAGGEPVEGGTFVVGLSG